MCKRVTAFFINIPMFESCTKIEAKIKAKLYKLNRVNNQTKLASADSTVSVQRSIVFVTNVFHILKISGYEGNNYLKKKECRFFKGN